LNAEPLNAYKEELKKNPVKPLSPPAVSETFSLLRILKELAFDEIEYRLKGLVCQAQQDSALVEEISPGNFGNATFW